MKTESDVPEDCDENEDSPPSSERPWLSLKAYTEESAAYFTGRDDEIENVLKLMEWTNLSVIFGVSGLGKTSLIQGGLFPRMWETDHVPVMVDLQFRSEINLLTQVCDALGEALEDARKKRGIIFKRPPLPGESLWGFFHEPELNVFSEDKRLLTTVLVFDQFERFFTYWEEADEKRRRTLGPQREELIKALAEVTENWVPDEIAKQVAGNPELAAKYDLSEQDFHIIISLREDYLPHLEELVQSIPSLRDNRFRLLPMSADQAREVVLNPGKEIVERPVAEQIVQLVAGQHQGYPNLVEEEAPGGNDGGTVSPAVPKNAPEGSSGEKDDVTVSPALLSLFCYELNERRLKAGANRIEAEHLQRGEQILEAFYERCFAKLPTQQRRAAERILQEELLLADTEFRDTVARKSLLQKFAAESIDGAQAGKVLDSLLRDRFVQFSSREGHRRVELTHDVLARELKRQMTRRLQEERRISDKTAEVFRAEGKSIEAFYRRCLIRVDPEIREATERILQDHLLQPDSADKNLIAWNTLMHAFEAESIASASAEAAIEALTEGQFLRATTRDRSRYVELTDSALARELHRQKERRIAAEEQRRAEKEKLLEEERRQRREFVEQAHKERRKLQKKLRFATILGVILIALVAGWIVKATRSARAEKNKAQKEEAQRKDEERKRLDEMRLKATQVVTLDRLNRETLQNSRFSATSLLSRKVENLSDEIDEIAKALEGAELPSDDIQTREWFSTLSSGGLASVVVPTAHDEPLTSVAWTYDQSFCCAVSARGQLLLLDLTSKTPGIKFEQLLLDEGHLISGAPGDDAERDDAILSFAYLSAFRSPLEEREAWVAVAGRGGKVYVLDLRSRKLVRGLSGSEQNGREGLEPSREPTRRTITSLAVSPDGSRVAAGYSSGQIDIWDCGSWEHEGTLFAGRSFGGLGFSDSRILNMAFNVNGARLMASQSEAVIVFDVEEMVTVDRSEARASHLRPIIFTPDNKRLLIGGLNEPKVMESTWGSGFKAKLPEQPSSADVRSDGTLFVAGTITGDLVFGTIEGNIIDVVKAHKGTVTATQFSADGKYLATTGQDGVCRIWHVRPTKAAGIYKGPRTGGRIVSYDDRNGEFLAIGGTDEQRWKIDPSVGGWKRVSTKLIPGKRFTHVSHAPLAQRCLVQRTPEEAIVWDHAEEKVHARIPCAGEEVKLALSPDSRWVACVSVDQDAGAQEGGQSVQLWEVGADGELTEYPRLAWHRGEIVDLAFDQQSRMLATGGQGGEILLWDLQKSAPDRALTPLVLNDAHAGTVMDLAFDATGTFLLSGGVDQIVKLWKRHEDVWMLERAFVGHDAEVWTVVFSPDSHEEFLSGDRDGRVYFWSSAASSPRLRLKASQEPVYSIAPGPRRDALAVADRDGGIRFWQRDLKAVGSYEEVRAGLGLEVRTGELVLLEPADHAKARLQYPTDPPRLDALERDFWWTRAWWVEGMQETVITVDQPTLEQIMAGAGACREFLRRYSASHAKHPYVARARAVIDALEGSLSSELTATLLSEVTDYPWECALPILKSLRPNYETLGSMDQRSFAHNLAMAKARYLKRILSHEQREIQVARKLLGIANDQDPEYAEIFEETLTEAVTWFERYEALGGDRGVEEREVTHSISKMLAKLTRTFFELVVDTPEEQREYEEQAKKWFDLAKRVDSGFEEDYSRALLESILEGDEEINEENIEANRRIVAVLMPGEFDEFADPLLEGPREALQAEAYGQAYEGFASAVALVPDSPEAAIGYSISAREYGEDLEAPQKILRDLLLRLREAEKEGEDEARLKRVRRDKLKVLAEMALNANARDEAVEANGFARRFIEEFQGQTRREPDDAGLYDAAARAISGNTALREGFPWECDEVFRAAVDLNPVDASLHQQFGLFLSRSGRFAAALPHYDRAGKLAPADPIVHTMMGYIRRKLWRPQQSVEAFDRAIAIDPVRSGSPHYWRGHVLAESARSDDQIKDALVSLHAAVELEGRDADYVIELARVEHRTGSTEKAVERLAGLDESDEARLLLAEIDWQRDRGSAKARTLFEAIAKGDDTQPGLLALSYLGREEEELSSWIKVARDLEAESRPAELLARSFAIAALRAPEASRERQSAHNRCLFWAVEAALRGWSESHVVSPDPIWEAVRTDKRFEEILRAMQDSNLTPMRSYRLARTACELPDLLEGTPEADHIDELVFRCLRNAIALGWQDWAMLGDSASLRAYVSAGNNNEFQQGVEKILNRDPFYVPGGAHLSAVKKAALNGELPADEVRNILKRREEPETSVDSSNSFGDLKTWEDYFGTIAPGRGQEWKAGYLPAGHPRYESHFRVTVTLSKIEKVKGAIELEVARDGMGDVSLVRFPTYRSAWPLGCALDLYLDRNE